MPITDLKNDTDLTGSATGLIPADTVLFLYDGLCGFCDTTVRWLIKRDVQGKILFAPRQAAVAQAIFARHGFAERVEDSVYLVERFGRQNERLLDRSDVMVRALQALGGGWGFMGRLLRLVPKGLRDAGYKVVARNRYRIAGRRTGCRVPTAEERSRFLGL